MLRQIKRIVTEPKYIFIYALYIFAKFIPDRLYLKLLFRLKMGYWMDFDNPQTFNEKLQWLKLYNRRPEYTQMVDKYAAKEYVASIIGAEYIIPTLGVWDSVEDIDFDSLPNQFVLKCTHDSGGIVICTDKSQLNIEEAKSKLKKGLKRDYYPTSREWPYKNVPHRIIAEQYMVDESGYELKDYKFFCFDGVPKALFIASDRGNTTEETKFDFFDMDFHHLPFTNGHSNAVKPVLKPKGFEMMKILAAKLSQGMPHARIDFYNINGQIYFGEITFFHWGGIVPFDPEEWDYTFGSWITLPEKQK
ncbi:MAG: glycosyl transferase [Rikenellaceae bacterium]|nr:glycosyl transferase [Rikenellaceae bacterium]